MTTIDDDEREYAYDPLAPGDEDWDPVEIYGYGCFETADGSFLCIDPVPYGPYYPDNEYGDVYLPYFECYYYYPYGYVCPYTLPYPYPYPPYYYYYQNEEPMAAIVIFSVMSFMMQIGGMATYLTGIMDRKDGTNYKGMLLAN